MSYSYSDGLQGEDGPGKGAQEPLPQSEDERVLSAYGMKELPAPAQPDLVGRSSKFHPPPLEKRWTPRRKKADALGRSWSG
jgi:hypothetical protein